MQSVLRVEKWAQPPPKGSSLFSERTTSWECLYTTKLRGARQGPFIALFVVHSFSIVLPQASPPSPGKRLLPYRQQEPSNRTAAKGQIPIWGGSPRRGTETKGDFSRQGVLQYVLLPRWVSLWAHCHLGWASSHPSDLFHSKARRGQFWQGSNSRVPLSVKCQGHPTLLVALTSRARGEAADESSSFAPSSSSFVPSAHIPPAAGGEEDHFAGSSKNGRRSLLRSNYIRPFPPDVRAGLGRAYCRGGNTVFTLPPHPQAIFRRCIVRVNVTDFVRSLWSGRRSNRLQIVPPPPLFCVSHTTRLCVHTLPTIAAKSPTSLLLHGEMWSANPQESHRVHCN